MTIGIGFYPPSDSTAVTSLPTPKATGLGGPYFSDGALGTNGTIVDCDFLNGIVAELQNLAIVGGVPLTATSPTVVPNIINIIAAQLTGYVRKIGDVMTGNLTLGATTGSNTTVPALIVENGTNALNIVMKTTAANQNPIAQAGDILLWYTAGSANTGALAIAPSGSGGTGGIRLDNTGAATFTRPTTLASVTVLGGAVGSTPATNNNSTSFATTAYFCNQAGALTPRMDGAATVGTSFNFARQDHIHPVDTSRQAALGFTPVQQGGGINQSNSKVYIGWQTGVGLALQVDNNTSLGYIPVTTLSNTFTATTNFTGAIYPTGGINTIGASIVTTNLSASAGIQGDTVVGLSSVATSSGNVTANNGYVRASYGSTASGRWDLDVCTLLADFAPGNPYYLNVNNNAWGGTMGYQVLPNGLILQWGSYGTYTGIMDYYGMPFAFPNFFGSIVASEGNVSGWSGSLNGYQNVTLYGCQRSGLQNFYVSCARFNNAAWGGGMTRGYGCNFHWLAIGW